MSSLGPRDTDTRKRNEKRHTKSKNSRKNKSTPHIQELLNDQALKWTIRDEYSFQNLGIEPIYKYKKIDLYELLRNERIQSAVKARRLYDAQQSEINWRTYAWMSLALNVLLTIGVILL